MKSYSPGVSLAQCHLTPSSNSHGKIFKPIFWKTWFGGTQNATGYNASSLYLNLENMKSQNFFLTV